jgi:hypothetical protein
METTHALLFRRLFHKNAGNEWRIHVKDREALWNVSVKFQGVTGISEHGKQE